MSFSLSLGFMFYMPESMNICETPESSKFEFLGQN